MIWPGGGVLLGRGSHWFFLVCQQRVKAFNKWSFPGGSSLRRADVSSSLITTEGRFTRRKRSLSGDERGETSGLRRPGGRGEGGILSIMVYTGRLALRPKGVHLSGFRYMKGWRFYSLKYLKGEGNRSFWSVKGPKRTNGWIFWLYKVH